jgi:2-dehydropantoate 2-reductase
MRVCIYGAGSVGGIIAARLSRVPGVDVSIIPRGEHLAALRRNGLKIVALDGAFSASATATDSPSDLGPQDYVFLTLKSQQVPGALATMPPLLGPKTTVLPPTTGVPYWSFYERAGVNENSRLERLDPGGAQREGIRPRRVLGCVFWVTAEIIAPGVIRQNASFARLPLGEPDGSESARVSELSRAMITAGFDSPVVDDIRSCIWGKMISSLCWNQVAVLTRATLGELNATPALVEIVRRMMIEADSVATALGAPPPATMTLERRIGYAASDHRMSMLRDLERVRPLEYQVIIDSIETMREIAGIETPTIGLVLALFKARVAKA